MQRQTNKTNKKKQETLTKVMFLIADLLSLTLHLLGGVTSAQMGVDVVNPSFCGRFGVHVDASCMPSRFTWKQYANTPTNA